MKRVADARRSWYAGPTTLAPSWWCLLTLFFGPECGGDILFRNISLLLAGYTNCIPENMNLHDSL
jgi:hypothetical protein